MLDPCTPAHLQIAADREAASLPRPSAPKAGATASSSAAGLDGSSSSSQQPPLPAGSVGIEVGLERAALQQQQRAAESAALDNAISYNEALIAERDEGIAEIQKQIVEVNEMFQDLAVLINDQGVQIATLDQQITTTAERVKEGTQELTKASRSMKSARNKCLCVWLVAAIVVSIIIILLFA